MGLRESKKLRTRQVIADESMRLFAQNGFDRVTVSEIAAAAGVSEKTVFNYFPTKEDLFFDEVPKRAEALVAAIRDREPEESILTARFPKPPIPKSIAASQPWTRRNDSKPLPR